MRRHDGVSHAAMTRAMPRLTANYLSTVLATAYLYLGLNHLGR